MNKTGVCISIALIIWSAALTYGQEGGPSGTPKRAALPLGFRDIELGLELDTVKELLKNDPYFNYRGDPDVSLLPQNNQQLIECIGLSYIKRAFFQFRERKLYTIILVLDVQKVDYYSLYETLTGSYGDAAYLDPNQAVWESEAVRLSLERPLSVKYVDKTVFDRIKKEGKAEESFRVLSREDFLKEFVK